jgi:glycosyltransferase involved in cell wall biosynthesis
VPGCAAPFEDRKDLMFLGGFNHPPNVDAVTYLVNDILPAIQRRLPDVKLYIVGSEPPEQIRRLANEHVIVTGFVADLEPYLSRVKISVAPLRYGAGVKGKINMSLSYGVPVVATQLAVEGMHLESGKDVLAADDAVAFADAVVKVYEDGALWNTLSRNGLAHTERHFSFAAARAAVAAMLDELLPASSHSTGQKT